MAIRVAKCRLVPVPSMSVSVSVAMAVFDTAMIAAAAAQQSVMRQATALRLACLT